MRARAMSVVQIPRTTDWTFAKKFAFSAFYTSANTFPLVVALLHWTVLGDRHDSHWSGDRTHDWIDFSTHGVSAIIAGLEILVLSSVKSIKVSIA